MSFPRKLSSRAILDICFSFLSKNLFQKMIPPPGSHLSVPGQPMLHGIPGGSGSAVPKRGSVFMSSESLATPPIPVLPMPSMRTTAMKTRLHRYVSFFIHYCRHRDRIYVVTHSTIARLCMAYIHIV